MEVACTAVVAESLPFAEDLVFGGGGEVFHLGPAADEPQPVVVSLLDACLLEDDFAEPDGVGVGSVSPGEVAGVFGKPVE